MRTTVLVAPAGRGVGLTTACLGIVRALDREGIRVAFAKPGEIGKLLLRETSSHPDGANPVPHLLALPTLHGTSLDANDILAQALSWSKSTTTGTAYGFYDITEM